MPQVKVHFLGASSCVTGSKFFIETGTLNIMVDCGMFQGEKKLREQNRIDLPIDVSSIDYVLLTHGHLDHCGYLPRLLQQGFQGKILGTTPTLEIAEIVLLDSAKIHEEEAHKATVEGYSKHHPPLPLYTIREAEQIIPCFKSIELDQWINLSDDIKIRFKYNGHIIGATFIEIDIYGKVYVFSGDIGRKEDILLYPPQTPRWADYLFLESTYGDKLHPKETTDKKLIELIEKTISNNGILIIPSFAIERLQVIMYLLWNLYKKNKVQRIPIYVDSPMGNKVISIFKKFVKWHKIEVKEFNQMLKYITVIKKYEDTWKTIDNPEPKIVIAASGMATGGRVLTYLKQLIDNINTTVLLIGYQAKGTRGRKLLEGATEVKIYGKYYPVNAKIEHIESLSAHADQGELLNWIRAIKNIPEKIFLIHGETESQEVLKNKIETEFKWHVSIPKINDVEFLN